MKYIFKLTIILITFTLVSYDQRYLLNKQFIKPEQATLATRKPGPPRMSGGPVLNEEGHLMGIHVGLIERDGDGEELLVLAFLREIPEQVEEVLVRVTPDIVFAAATEKGDVELQQQLAAKRRKREEAERRLQ